MLISLTPAQRTYLRKMVATHIAMLEDTEARVGTTASNSLVALMKKEIAELNELLTAVSTDAIAPLTDKP